MAKRSADKRRSTSMGSATATRAPTSAQERALASEEIDDGAIWAQVMRVSGQHSPAQISATLKEADQGRIKRLVDLTHELRQKDGQLQTVMQTRELAVSGLPWDLQLGDGAKKRDQKANQRLKEALERAEGFSEAIAHLVGEPVLFGFGVVEVIWALADDGIFEPVRFKIVPCRRFGYRMRDGALLFDQSAVGSGNIETTGIDLEDEFPPGKFLVVRRRINGDVPVREGLSRLLCWLTSFRLWGRMDWLKFAEIGWKPWRTAEYKKDAEKEDKIAARTIMRQLNASGVAVHPETIKIALHWAKNSAGGGQGGAHGQLAEHLGMEISKPVLGGTLTVESGSRGARSLGEVHNEVRKDIRDADCLAIASEVGRGLVDPYMRMNHGARAESGVFFFQTEDPVDLKAYAEALKLLTEAGLQRIPASHVRDQAGIPEAKPDEEVLAPAKADAPPTDNDDGEGNEPDEDTGAGDGD